MEIKDVLLIKFTPSHMNEEITIFDYLKLLLTTLWEEEEGFSGKRPFGNSGWTWEVYAALIANGVLPGSLDEDGHIKTLDDVAASKYVVEVLIPAFAKI